jgi:hypothetical protein
MAADVDLENSHPSVESFLKATRHGETIVVSATVSKPVR